MQIRRVTIDNFKSIEHLDITCGDRLNAFIGANGSGKSSVLEAIYMLLSWVQSRVLNVRASGTSIHPSQIRKGAPFARLSIEVVLEGESYTWSLYKQSTDVRSKLDNDSGSLTDSKACANHIFRLLEEGQVGPPVITYFGVNRAVDTVPRGISTKKHKLEPKDIYEEDSQVSFRRLFEWMLERQIIENDDFRKKKESGEPFVEDRQLSTVKGAIAGTFGKEYSNLRVESNPRRVVIDKMVEGVSKEYELDQLSDGEKCYLAVVASIARLLAMAAPQDAKPLEGSGIILIDEVDLHLHPEWQMEIIPRLREVFPNCQFLITTHSPHVISSIHDGDSSCLVSMDKGVGTVIRDSWYGKESDTILLRYFDLPHVRTREVADLLNKARRELKEGKMDSAVYKEAKQELMKLLDPNDSALLALHLQEALMAKRSNETGK